MKPTSGPWIADCIGDMDGYSTVRIADGSEYGNTETQPIATVYVDADARLIAAAPDLLAALTRCEEYLCEMGCDCGVEIGDDGDVHTSDCMLGQVQTAISKAEGR